jgi:hypothetical protein
VRMRTGARPVRPVSNLLKPRLNATTPTLKP